MTPRPAMGAQHTAERSAGRDAQGAESVATVAVVIPCYQQAEFLTEAVESVVGQSFTDWEIVIVDDGSPDDTVTVAEDLIARHPDRRISLVRQANGGLAAARNAGIAASSGRYLLPLDADDILLPGMLDRTVALLDHEPRVAIAYTDQLQFGTVDRVVRLVEWDPELLRRRNIFAATALYRREVWEAVGGYDPEMRDGYEDWDFWIGAAESGFEARRLPEPLFGYRIRASSMHRTAREQRHRQLTSRIRRKHPRTYRHPWRYWRRWPSRLLGRLRYLIAADDAERVK